MTNETDDTDTLKLVCIKDFGGQLVVGATYTTDHVMSTNGRSLYHLIGVCGYFADCYFEVIE